MHDLDEQIRDFIDSGCNPVTADEVLAAHVTSGGESHVHPHLFSTRTISFFATGVVLIAASLVLGLLLTAGTQQPKSVSESSLGFRITSYSTQLPTTAKPHLLNEQLTIGFLPPGYHLVSDTQANKTTRPYDFRRTILFGTGVNKGQYLQVIVDQSSSWDGVVRGTPSNPGATVTTTKVRGHIGQAITTLPESGRNQTSVTLQWIETPGIGMQIGGGEGLSLEQLQQVAANLTIHSDFQKCIVHGLVGTTESCAPGTISSPSINPVPPGSSVLATGSVNGGAWVLSGSSTNGRTVVGISYDDSIVELVSTGIGVPGHPVPTLAVGLATALNGQRFFIGATTSEVTSVVVTSKNGTTVRVPTLPHVLKSHSVFVLSLGVVHGVCDDLCQGKIGVSFFHDAKSLPFSLPGCGVRFADGGCDGYIGTTIPLGLK